MTTTAFCGGTVLDGTRATPRLADVLIEDGLILAVGPGLSGDIQVDCTDRTLIPGLFDCHVHIRLPDVEGLLEILSTPLDESLLRFPQTARTYLELGITTVRDASLASLGMKTAIDKGIVVGPRMQISITMLGMTGGHSDGYMAIGCDPLSGIHLPGYPDEICDGVDACIAKTREVIRAGADVVKVATSGGFMSPNDNPQHPTFSQAELDAIVSTAADLERPVMAHSHGAEGIKRAVRAGVRSIEHGTYLDEEGAEMMAEAGTWLVATLTAGDTTEQLANDETMEQSVRDKFAALGTPERDGFRLAVNHGVKIAMGTDCPMAPHGTNLRELELMVECGLTPEQSLIAATSGAAELMGLDDQLGTLEPGKIADLVVVNGDPLDFVSLSKNIEQVWKDGSQVV